MRRFALGVPTALLLCSVLLVGCPKPNITLNPAGLLAFEPEAPTMQLTIENTSRGTVELEVEVTANAPWLTVDDAPTITFTLKKSDPAKVVNVAVAYEEAFEKAAFAESTVTVVATAADFDDVTKVVTVTTGNPQYWTQSYDPALEGKMVIFSQVNTPRFYKAEIADVSAFGPDMRVDLGALTPIDFLTDPVFVDFTDSGKTVSLYGEAYTGVFVSSDGRVAFEAAAPVTEESDLFAAHFATAGVSGLLAPADAALGDVYAIELPDRMLIVKDGGGVADSFQVELFFDEVEESAEKAGIPGAIAIAWFSVDEMIDAVVGLSEGGYTGVPADFLYATDLINEATTTFNTLPLEVAKGF